MRAKFALTDAYEDHFLLPKGRIVVVTHRRVILLQVSSTLTIWWILKGLIILMKFLILSSVDGMLMFFVFYYQQPSNIIAQKKFNPARDPCSVSWDMVWDDLVMMELTHGKKDHPSDPPSRLILYLQSKSLEAKDQVRVIKCNRNSNQAMEVYTSIEQARSTYGPSRLQVDAVSVVFSTTFSLLQLK